MTGRPVGGQNDDEDKAYVRSRYDCRLMQIISGKPPSDYFRRAPLAARSTKAKTIEQFGEDGRIEATLRFLRGEGDTEDYHEVRAIQKITTVYAGDCDDEKWKVQALKTEA